MWKNLNKEMETDDYHVSKVPTKVQHRRTDLFVDALVKTFPTLRSDLLKRLDEFHDTCVRAGFSRVVLGEGNADWLAISLVSGATSAPIAQNLLVEMLAEGVLLNSTALKETRHRVHEAFLPCHVVTFGRVENAEMLFRECIKLAAVLDTNVITAEGIHALSQRLNFDMEVHVAEFPSGVRCPTFRKTHILNLNAPKKHRTHYSADFTRVLSVPNSGRLRVNMSLYAGKSDILACRFCIPVNVVHNGYVLSYDLVVGEIQCVIRYEGYHVVRTIPSSSGYLTMLPWLEYCKLLTIRRRGVAAMAVVSVFVFFHLWEPSDAKRLREIMVMLRSRQPSEVTSCLLGVLMFFEMERKDLTTAVHKASRCMTLIAESIAANYSFRNDDNFDVTYVSPITMR